MRKGNVDEAIQQYQRAAELKPKDRAIRSALADAISARIKPDEHKTPFRDENPAPPAR